MNQGLKFDTGKPRMDFILEGMPNALLEIGKVATFGANKYAPHSWRGVEDAQCRYLAALMRHLLADARGEELDPESGLLHLAHAAWGALAILELKTLRSEA